MNKRVKAEVQITAFNPGERYGYETFTASYVATRPDGDTDAGQESFTSDEQRLAAVKGWVTWYQEHQYRIHTKGFGRYFTAKKPNN